MSKTEEQKKAAHLAQVMDAIRQGAGKDRAADFAAELFRRAPADELLSVDPRQHAALATQFFDFAQQRRAGEIKLRIYNPEPDKHGWETTHTVLEIINDDMPFLVDSVVLALSDLGISAHLIVHPVLHVRRDQGGHWLGLDDSDGDQGASESLMHVQFDRQTYPETLARIERRVRSGLADVARAVSDWPAMVEQARRIAERLPETHAPMGAGTMKETQDFFEWLADDHFTFLGYREYVIEDSPQGRVLKPVPGSGLGIMHDEHRQAPARLITDLGPGVAEPTVHDPVIITKTNGTSTVHRGGYMDYISVLHFDEDGRVRGEKRLIGLFTSGAYIRRCQDTPLVRMKVREVIEQSGLRRGSHAGKALQHILETLPRDELFQASSSDLLDLVTGILDLQERSQTRLFIRRERFGRFFSCLVFIPRDRFNTENRQKIQQILKRTLKGERLDFAVQVGESNLARVHVVVRPKGGQAIDYDLADIEAKIKQAVRAWSDELSEILVREHGEEQGLEMSRRYGDAFPASYTEDVSPSVAAYDVANVAYLRDLDDLRMSLYKPRQRERGILRFKLFKHGDPIPLSDVLPMLENLGMRIVSERPYELRLGQRSRVWIQDFDMRPPDGEEIRLDLIRENFQTAFEQTWRRRCENDGFNRLVLKAHMGWRQVTLLRACCKYLLQTGIPFSQSYMEQTLAAWPLIARLLVEYFELRFDPDRARWNKAQRGSARKRLEHQCRSLLAGYQDEVLHELVAELCEGLEQGQADADAMPIRKTILRAIDSVTSADQDRILRAFYDLIRSMLRTNFFQLDARGEPHEHMSFKLDSSLVPELPRPRPYREIWVYSPRVEGIHLRGGKVARGGLRWSDRREDFRTEVLGLMRAQNVKNTMIVPVGAKGGFVVKQPPEGEDRDAMIAEVVYCYRSFIHGLLDITDNLDGEDIRPPERVVRHDDDDPYLVVAADKGTATFSDIANAISAEHGFWMDDAFASGGSNGYDHKKMGITAKGAWESVKRHFRELGLDTQSEAFSVVGIGDMAGDVFGNGMLLSRHIRLKAAFNHMHIFLDPHPDEEASYKERKRLFELPRSTWADYDSKLISPGGGVFSRQAKSIELSDQVREWLGIEERSLAPHELIRALLKAPVDLLWNGGIGTYVKAETETHADVGDLANNLVRVNGKELRCRVVGEGGNLGLTQLGRIEYALSGGRINTDFIDNSAGVDCSDHEVNIKILLNLAMDRGRLDVSARNELLSEMTAEVSDLVLRSNYLQTQALSMMESMTGDRLGAEEHFIAMLDRQGVFDRDLEQLPDEEALRERVARGQGLTRPELSLLLSYGKITLYKDLLASDVPEDPYLSRELEGYFPSALRERFGDLMPEHRLWREIIATKVTNSIVNRMGANFAMRLREDTGANSATIAKAYTVVREIFGARDYWAAIEALDNQVPASLQTEAILEMWNLLRQMTRRLIALPGGYAIDISSKVQRFAPGIEIYSSCLDKVLSSGLKARLVERRASLVEAGMPEELAQRIAQLRYMNASLDIVDEARTQERDVAEVTRIYFELLNRLSLKWLRQQVEKLPVERQWHAHARGNLRDELYDYHRHLTRRVLTECGEEEKPVEAWFKRFEAEISRVSVMLEEMRNMGQADYPSMQVAIKGLGQLLNATS
ncbi:NAD-glutamate dehydrogenase [Wenzhouxiangella marina]|uniref:Glutamate dehydrogenase n=1 Tax=Wenzhouxiangella marina TaxID=1579979 RepID=A0A0K0XVV4_9GAMM|nr:NAD-glutamate dehydrogenase domain-containing protein [Wenzhouxiangella marina]AKS41746.1 glutamate dehydrogenase [Wenzhouxiangella marina]MBB6086492.1 glutamate dehydrogenase [Wenzhouxiangella marina]